MLLGLGILCQLLLVPMIKFIMRCTLSSESNKAAVVCANEEKTIQQEQQLPEHKSYVPCDICTKIIDKGTDFKNSSKLIRTMINRLELQLDNKSCSYWIVTSRFELPLVDLNYDKLLEFTSQLDILRRINLIKMSSLKSSQIEVIYHDSPT